MIDSHSHLNEVGEVEQAIRAAAAAGIQGIVAVGMDVDSNRVILELAERFPEMVHPAIGYHPWSVAEATIEENVSFIDANLAECRALGEVGLDYKAKAKKKLQWEVFSRLLVVARRHEKPVIVHSRFSHQRTHLMVKEAGIKKAVFHWYSGALDVLENILADGYYVSATPALAYSTAHQDAMKAAPLGRILVETDSPVEYGGRASAPVDLITTLNELSRVKEVEPIKVREVTTANAREFFGI